MAATVEQLWFPTTEQERTEVVVQLQRLLDSHEFRHSQRYPALLKYVVEQTLSGHADQLKERLLGIEVFHRDPGYDTNADPVVRVTAGEVRKRIAQYYQDRPEELRIQLPAGSYVPQFRQALHPVPELPSLPILSSVPAEPSPVLETASRWSTLRPMTLFGGAMVGALLLISAVAAILYLKRTTPVEAFWSPFLQASDGPVMVLGDHGVPLSDLGLVAQAFAASADDGTVHSTDTNAPREMLSVGDGLAFARVSNMLGAHAISFDAQTEAQTSLDTLRERPAVIVGAFNNPWALHASSMLRFRFRRVFRPDGSQVVSIIDSKAAKGNSWPIVWSQPLVSKTHDYAIVARYFDPETEKPVVLISGLGENGTVAAGEFVTQDHYLRQLDAFAPQRLWAKRNLEAVIETPVVDGLSGAPHLVAAYFW